jgi:hypothetical protein
MTKMISKAELDDIIDSVGEDIKELMADTWTTIDARLKKMKEDLTKEPKPIKERIAKASLEFAHLGVTLDQLAAESRNFRAPCKADLIADMLLKPEGATAKELKAAAGWTRISVPAQAAMRGIELIIKKDLATGNNRYFGHRPGEKPGVAPFKYAGEEDWPSVVKLSGWRGIDEEDVDAEFA